MSEVNPKDEVFINLILQATKGLYQRYGYKKVTMADVAKEVGKTRSALYYYFKNREQLFEAVLFSLVDEVKKDLLAVMFENDSLETKLKAFCVIKIKGSKKIQAFYSNIEIEMDTEERSNYAQIKWQVHKKMMETETDMLMGVINSSIKKQEIPIQTEAQLKIVVFVLLSGIRGIRRELSIDTYSKNWKEGAAMLARMIVSELRSQAT